MGKKEDLRRLSKEIRQCQNCNLHKGCTQKVVGKGHVDPEVLIIGEAPGAEEDKRGTPFCGRSGKMLDEWIDFLDIRDKVAVVNCVKCRPEGNADPKKEELDACRPWLDRQIEFFNPTTIILVGRIAMNQFFPKKDRILKEAGKEYDIDGKQFFIMPHPAYYLRHGGTGWEMPLMDIFNNMREKSQQYTPLHCHTEYSFLDGTCQINDFVQEAKDRGFEHLAITDHGTISGWFEFQKVCEEKDIHPILGIEFYVTTGYDVKTNKRYHLVVLAKNQVGIKNLFALDSIAHSQGFYRKPRITLTDVISHKEGLVVLAACTLGVVSQRIVDGEIQDAYEIAERLKCEFGEDFYLEIQPHDFNHQYIVNAAIPKIGEELGIKTVITTDVHYLTRQHKELHNAVKAISWRNAKYGDRNFTGDTHCLLLESELRPAMKVVGIEGEFYEECLRNTMEVAEKCEGFLPKYDTVIPNFIIPDEVD